jgi:retinol dehydrogenase-12
MPEPSLDTASVAGRWVVVTGATSGLGEATAQALLRRGARVVVVGRDASRIAAALDRLRGAVPGATVESARADLSELEEVRRLAGELSVRFPRLEVLVNNAGAIFAERGLTREGRERTWALNVLSPFLLTHLLRDPLRAGGAGRVVMVASAAHRYQRLDLSDPEGLGWYRGYRAYARSKLALILLTKEFGRRWADEPIWVNAVHPGFVASGFGKNNRGGLGGFFAVTEALFGISPARGARTIVHVAADPEGGRVRGRYFAHGHLARVDPAAEDEATAARLWTMCALATGAPGANP